jgi:hypothetical protein
MSALPQKHYLPTTIIPLVDQLWLPLSDTTLFRSKINTLGLEHSPTSPEAYKQELENNLNKWIKSVGEQTDVTLFLYELRFNNVTLKKSIQQWIYAKCGEGYVNEEGSGENVVNVGWEELNERTNKMCQLYQRDMRIFTQEQMKENNILTENVDISPSCDTLNEEDQKYIRMVTIPLFHHDSKTLYFIHTPMSSFTCEIQSI